jgi:hypothetical protein
VQKLYALPEDDPDPQVLRHDIADAKKLLEAASFDFRRTGACHSVRRVEVQLAKFCRRSSNAAA